MFKIGDKVICINVNAPMSGVVMPVLKLGGIYTVKNIQYCQYCGEQKLDVGTKYQTNPLNDMHFCKCKQILKNIINVPCAASRFIKLKDLDKYLFQMEQEENYEMCQVLLKIKENQLVER